MPRHRLDLPRRVRDRERRVVDASELRRWALRVLDTPRTVAAAEALIEDLLESAQVECEEDHCADGDCLECEEDHCEGEHVVDIGPGVPTGRLSDRDYLIIA